MPTRSILFGIQQPGGALSVIDLEQHPRDVWFVDASAAGGGNTVGHGQHPDTPFLSLAYAFSSDLLGAGDVVYLMPGHTESVSAAAGIDADIAGVKVIGLGFGRNRPTITFDTIDSADIDIDAANITFQNIRFVTDIASCAAPIDVNAAGFTIEDCDFYGNDAADETNLITIITDANADELTVRRCTFNYLAALDATPITTTSTECIRLVGADRAIIEDNYISGDFTTSAINGITTASLDVQILRNRIHNIAIENIAGVVDLVAGCNGIIGHNYGFIGYTVALGAVIDPSSCAMVQNYFSNVVTEAAGLVGTAST